MHGQCQTRTEPPTLLSGVTTWQYQWRASRKRHFKGGFVASRQASTPESVNGVAPCVNTRPPESTSNESSFGATVMRAGGSEIANATPRFFRARLAGADQSLAGTGGTPGVGATPADPGLVVPLLGDQGLDGHRPRSLLHGRTRGERAVLENLRLAFEPAGHASGGHTGVLA